MPTHRMSTSLFFLSFSEDAMRKAGVAHSKSSKDMESHVFLKAKTRVRPRWAEPMAERLRKGRCDADPRNFSAWGVEKGWLLTD